MSLILFHRSNTIENILFFFYVESHVGWDGGFGLSRAIFTL